jgi:hypothetical protein
MPFDQHLFISYAHLDNQPLAPKQMGFISRFHEMLKVVLGIRLGCEARIWRDDKLRGNDVFTPEILGQLQNSALVASVLSRRYLESEWCRREINEFCEVAHAAGKLRLGNQARVFKVLMEPLTDQTPLHASIREPTGFPFYQMEEDAPLHLDPVYGPEFEQLLAKRVALLAWRMSELIRKLEPGGGGGDGGRSGGRTGGESVGNGGKDLKEARVVAVSKVTSEGTTAPQRGRTIYVAECAEDRLEDRESLMAELSLWGYSVLPNEPLPLDDEPRCAERVRAVLGACELSVHLVGRAYGDVLPGGKSLVVLQNEVCAEFARTEALRRLISLPKGTAAKHARQQAFIEQLETNAKAQRGADLLGGDLESFKTAMHRTLENLSKPRSLWPPATRSPNGARPLVYMMCTEQDRRAAVPLLGFLTSHGFDPKLPAFTGDATTVREVHESLLADADAVFLYYGQGDEAWRSHQEQELRRSRALRTQPPVAIVTYLAEPLNEDKAILLATRGPNLVDATSGFSAEALEPFVAKVREAGTRPTER